MAMEVNFIPNWVENQDSGIWYPQKKCRHSCERGLNTAKTKIKLMHLPTLPPLLSANYHALSVEHSQLYFSSLTYKTV